MGASQSKRKSPKRKFSSVFHDRSHHICSDGPGVVDQGYRRSFDTGNSANHLHHHHHHHHHHRLEDATLRVESSSSTSFSASSYSSMDSRIPLHGGANLPPEKRKTFPTGAARKTGGVDTTEKIQAKATNMRRTFARLIDTCFERFRKKTTEKQANKIKVIDDASDDDALTSNEVTASPLPVEAERLRVKLEADERRKDYERNVRIGTIWRENADDRTTQEKPEQVTKSKHNKTKKKKKINTAKDKEANCEDDDETTKDRTAKPVSQIERGPRDDSMQLPSFHFNDKILADMIEQNMTKNNIFINSRSEQTPEGLIRRRRNRPKPFVGRHGNLDRLVVKSDACHDCVTRIYLVHSPEQHDHVEYLETQVRTLPGAVCPSIDLRIVHSHGVGCAAVFDADDSVLTFRVEGVRRRRRRHDVNPDVMTSRHYWQRHRHRHRNERRAMNKVADWIDTELTECRSFGFRSQ